MPRIASLHVYPVKSCGGVSAPAFELADHGLAHDREWMIVDATGKFVTQREEPRLALIRTAIAGRSLRLDAPGAKQLRVALTHAGERVEVNVWRSHCAAFDAGDGAADWLRAVLGRNLRLVRFDRARPRLSDREFTGDIAAPNTFTDGYPFMVLSRASIDDLNARVGRTFGVERFRPNLVLDGIEAYAEDGLHELEAGEVTLRLVKRCTRCAIVTTDQATGQRDGDEPLRTLRGYRHDRELRGVVFGVNAIIVRGEGKTLRAGQEVVVR